MTDTSPDTDALLTLCSQGDPDAIDSLLDRHRDRVRRMVQVHWDHRLRGRLDPSDVVQEALTEAAQKLPQYLESRPIAFYPWLRQIAWQRLVRLYERHVLAGKRSVEREAGWQPRLSDDSAAVMARQFAAVGPSPSRQLIQKELIDRLRAAVDQLAPQDRTLVMLRYMEQLTFQEVADVMGLTVGAVKTRHFRLVRQLHRSLQQDCGEESS